MADQKATSPAPTPVTFVPREPVVPEWSDKIVKVRITPAGAKKTAVYNGKTYTADSEMESPGDLHALARASMDGSLVIEKYNKDGVEVNAAGEPAKFISKDMVRPQLTKKDADKMQAKMAELWAKEQEEESKKKGKE
jgi:hypothetical protein